MEGGKGDKKRYKGGDEVSDHQSNSNKKSSPQPPLKFDQLHSRLREQLKQNHKFFFTDTEKSLNHYKKVDVDNIFGINSTPTPTSSSSSSTKQEYFDRYTERTEDLIQECSSIILATLTKMHFQGMKKKFKQKDKLDGEGTFTIKQDLLQHFTNDILTVLGSGARELNALKIESSLPTMEQRLKYLEEEWEQTSKSLLEQEKNEIQASGQKLNGELSALDKEMEKDLASIKPTKEKDSKLSKIQAEQQMERDKLAKELSLDPETVAEKTNPKGVWTTKFAALKSKHDEQIKKYEDKQKRLDHQSAKSKITEKYNTLKQNVRNKYDEKLIKNRYQEVYQILNTNFTKRKNLLLQGGSDGDNIKNNHNHQNEEPQKMEIENVNVNVNVVDVKQIINHKEENKVIIENEKVEVTTNQSMEVDEKVLSVSVESTSSSTSGKTDESSLTLTITESDTLTSTTTTTNADTTTSQLKYRKKPVDPFEQVDFKIQRATKAALEAAEAVKDFKSKNTIIVDKEILDRLTQADFNTNKALVKTLKKLTKKKAVQEKRIKALQERKAQLQFIMSRAVRPILPPPTKESYEKLLSDCNLLYPQLICTDSQRGKKLLPYLQDLLNKALRPVKVEIYLFGSSSNGLAFKNSDLDISLVTDRPLHNLANYTFKVSNVLKSNKFQNVIAITRTRVPIIRFNDLFSSLSCDLSINNPLAIFNSRMIYDYMQIDIRVRTVAVIVKQWAKVRCINDASNNSLHSYSFVNMIIHFMQREEIMLLPSLQRMANGQYYYLKGRRFGDGRIKEDQMISGKNCKYYNNVSQLKEVFGKHNTMTVPELLFAFFQYYALKYDYQNSVISIRSGELLPANTKVWDDKKEYFFMIEDPFDTTFNMARSIRKPHHLAAIVKEFMRAYELLSNNAPLDELLKPPLDNINDYKKDKLKLQQK